MGECWVAIRPERIQLATAPEQVVEHNRVAGTIEAIFYLGAQSTCHVRITDDVLLQVVIPAERRTGPPLARGDRVWLAWSPESQVVLDT
jgi:ABC-type Fe3+/spermidine/putrescine transport system ATPase subunit